jgi:hypothetical protein
VRHIFAEQTAKMTAYGYRNVAAKDLTTVFSILDRNMEPLLATCEESI